MGKGPAIPVRVLRVYLMVTDIWAPEVQLLGLKVKFESANCGFNATATFFAAVLAAV
jgi:hypothetical protein